MISDSGTVQGVLMRKYVLLQKVLASIFTQLTFSFSTKSKSVTPDRSLYVSNILNYVHSS